MKFWNYIIAALIGAVLTLALPQQGNAKVLIFDYTARVDELGASVPTGTMVTGQFSYDDALVPQNVYPGAYTNVATYQNSTVFFTINLGSKSVAGNGVATVADSHTAYGPSLPVDEDYFFFGTIATPTNPLSMGMTIWGPGDQWLTSTKLPSSFPAIFPPPPPPASGDDDEITSFGGGLFYSDGLNKFHFNANLLTITPVAGGVPEPSTWALKILGFGGIGAAMRRRRKVRTETAAA
ncbi:MAG: PEPxxWA-CTERM sorting domain-containing protein [Sphingobium sp.]|jgi:hypothetical protein|uniref:PEPxxWA-CTERM sorting domain-containing protein n=1 Tax=Caldilinea sp. TaxID=2293560 RepID=UPI002C2D2595|nr:PEPxxWA-CTERM sorting domain-containing protein [Sphingobium sp.]MCI1270584.1 PEPxxWA-CTERM sorting domain-containing protein [Sphingobium sp.]MCI1757226.1 PEPxxWA-CTERM sorting domain-containing protein [Sphingobium sp.]MCI2052742.1 PEPxxWA-CTERM sorting domain-containing protein [Sphingobium sp.]HQY95332.1 PEPxxWA-CTERM sorting domain-containing protein [Caldilinea sp.]